MKKVKKPFFVKLLESQKIEESQNVKGGTDFEKPGPTVTLKYPSDIDEPTTLKYPSDSDEHLQTVD